MTAAQHRRGRRRLIRAPIACALLTGLALSAHAFSTTWLGARDPIALAAGGHWVGPAFAALVLFGARAFLLIAAGWWLWLGVSGLFDRLPRSRSAP